MEIKKENVLKAYNTAKECGADSTVKVLEELFGKETFKPADVRERIKTFGDACRELGANHPLVLQYEFNYNVEGGWNDNADTIDFAAYLKLRIICAALNEGWEPRFTEDEWRYYPWFYLYTQQELDNMDDEEKQERHMIGTGDYETEYCGFGYALSSYVPSATFANVGSRLCLKNSELATYCGKQFIDLWADFNLIRSR